MRALTYHGPGQLRWDDIDEPEIVDPTDALVRVDTTTICGTDLHIRDGNVPDVALGRVLGHEAVGTVTAIGSAVTKISVGRRVLVSCISACGSCVYCRHRHYGQCLGGGGWILGHRVDGVQATNVRVPYADNSTYPVPFAVSDERMILLADIMPTAYEVGVLNGHVHPGDVIAIVGAGPIGLAVVQMAKLVTPRHIVVIDTAECRLRVARSLGGVIAMNPREGSPRAVIEELTDGLGADVTFEAVGLPETFEEAMSLVRPGGHVANIGVHGVPASLHLEKIWDKNLTITTGLVDAYSTSTLIRLVQSRHLGEDSIITHRLPLEEILTAYEIFSRPGETGALKILLTG